MLHNFRIKTHNTFRESTLKEDIVLSAMKDKWWDFVSVSDKNNVYGYLHIIKHAKKNHIKYGLGIDFDVTISKEDWFPLNMFWNFILLPKDWEWFHSIMKLGSKHFMKSANKREIPYSDIVKLTNIYILSGDTKSFIMQMLDKWMEDEAKMFVKKCVNDFWYKFQLEILEGYNKTKQIDDYNNFIVKIYNEWICKNIVLSVPFLYADKKNKDGFICVKLMEEGKNIDESNDVDIWEFHIRTPEEMQEIAKKYSIEFNNQKIVDSINQDISYSGYVVPKFSIEDTKIIEEYNKTVQYWKNRWWYTQLPLSSFAIRYMWYIWMREKEWIHFEDTDIPILCWINTHTPYSQDYLKQNEEDTIKEITKQFYHKDKINLLNNMNKRDVEIIHQFDFEQYVIEVMWFNDYFLIVQDYCNWARNNWLLVWTWRGSAPWSMLTYLLWITSINPLKYGLLFSRFMNVNRISMPDIDVDFSDRDKVIEYVTKKYGKKNTVQICTFWKMQDRSVFKDLCKIYWIPFYKSNELSQMIEIEKSEDDEEEKLGALEDTYKKNKDFRNEINSNEVLKKVYKLSLELLWNNRQIWIHACAVVISPVEVTWYTIVEKREKNWREVFVTQNEWKDIEEMWLLKMDFLWVKTLKIMQNSIKDIKKHKRIDLNLDKIDLEDERILKNIYWRWDTEWVFQFESSWMKKYLRELNPDKFEDIVALWALYRPWPIAYIPSYINRKHWLEKIDSIHPDLTNVTKETYWILCYQEQVMQFSRIYSWFSAGEADMLRKAVGKKDSKLMEEVWKMYIEKSNKLGKDEQISTKIWKDIILPFGSYSFNKSHSLCYSVISFQTAYLKEYYKSFFFTHFLNEEINWEEDKKKQYIENVIATWINILPPNINKSSIKFEYIDDKTINFWLEWLKWIGEDVLKYIIKERDINWEFTSFENFIRRVPKKCVNKKVLWSLTKSGAFDIFWIERDILIYNIDTVPNIKEFKDNLEEGKETELKLDTKYVGRERIDLVLQNLEWEFEVMCYNFNHPFNGFKSLLRKNLVWLENIIMKKNWPVQFIWFVDDIKNSSYWVTLQVDSSDFHIWISIKMWEWQKLKETIWRYSIINVSGETKTTKDWRWFFKYSNIKSLPIGMFLEKVKGEKKMIESEMIDRSILLLDKMGLKRNLVVDLTGMNMKKINKFKEKIISLPTGPNNVVIKIWDTLKVSKYTIVDLPEWRLQQMADELK